MYPDAIRNPEGKVYIRYYMPTNKYIKVGNREYVSTVQHAVSMFLAEEEDVPAILSFEGGCCGGRKKIFSLPNQESINVWLTGNR